VSGLLIAVVLLLAAVAQVTVAPLFPVSAAIPNLALMALVLVAAFGGAKAVMVGTPFLALSLAFLSDRSAALLLLAYLPLLPLAAYLDSTRIPMNRYVQTLVAAGAVGAFVRVLLALAAISSGAEASLTVLLVQVLLPGLLLDSALLTLAYIPLRFVGLEPRSLTLQRGGF
jgi:cell shape-determining protein MreD